MSESEHPTYEIASLWDFLNVPEERLAACLDEFRAALLSVNSTADLIEEVTGYRPAIPVQPFIWIDDGEKLTRIVLQAKPEEDEE